MNLSFRHLQTFVEVIHSGSVSEAGRVLGRTQPAISAMLASLEKELGFSLFVRERKRLIPKPEAYYFLEEAEAILARLAKSARTMQEIGNLKKGKLRIACNPAASGFIMPKVVSKFLENRPEVKVSLMMRSSEVVEEWVASQQYDIGFAEAFPERNTVKAETFELKSVCAIPGNSPLAKKEFITPSDLADEPLALLYDEHVTFTKTRQSFLEVGAAMNQRFELRTFLPALQLVADGLCFCICDQISAASYNLYRPAIGGIVFKPFRPTITLPMSIITPANRPASFLAVEFSKLLREEIKELSKPELKVFTGQS